MNTSQQLQEDSFSLTEVFLRRDPVRWIAGGMAGAFAGLVGIGVAVIIAVIFGHEAWFPIKAAAVPVLGYHATEFGFHVGRILVGFGLIEAICIAQGIVYGHVTSTNSPGPLLAVGLVFAAFSWVFIFNLFTQSFPEFYALQLSPGAAFFAIVAFGISLSSLCFFDRMVRGRPL
jgi:hypothetical protein